MAAGRIVTVLALLLISSQAVHAQYFGQNKVRHENLQFQVLRTDRFDIYFYEDQRRVIDVAGQLAERWYDRLSTVFGHELSGRQPLVLYANHPDFRQTTVISGFIDPSTGGVTEGLQRRIVMPFTASLQETDHVLGHELVHAFQYDMGGRGLQQLPLWFIEGLAEYLSLGPVDAQTAAWLRDAALHEELPGFEDLDNPRYFPYRFGHAAWAYLGGRFGQGIVPELFQLASRSGDPLGAIEQVTRMPLEDLTRAWHLAVAKTYGSIDLADVAPRGRALITDEHGGRLNVGPSISPDGTRLVFLSERSLFAIEMFLADAETGEIIGKLTDVATDAHLDNIQFLQSTGAWSPDGRRFAYAAEDKARPVLVVVDGDTGRKLQTHTFPGLGEIFTPTWSPDGRSIAFSAIVGATSDLFVYELERETLRRLTDDLYAQLQPAWSPDGRTLAFVTDRFTTDLDTLDFGRYRVAGYDFQSGAIRLLPGFDGSKNINPQWAPGGKAYYFIGAPNGVPNVFRADLSTGDLEPVTSLKTAVSGITDLSPALGVAQKTGALAYTAYIDGRYAIYALTDAEARRGVRLAGRSADTLPPPGGRALPFARRLDTPQAELPSPEGFAVHDYRGRLSLQYVGAAAASRFGTDQFGTFVGGGVAFLFGDVLNEHQLSAAVQSSGGVSDIAAQLGYLNQQSRWNWGGIVQRIPYRTGTVRSAFAEVDGQQVFVEQTTLFRQTSYEISGIAGYPFSREARLEFTGGLQHVGFDREVRSDIFSAQTGGFLDRRTQELDAPEALNLGRASAAFVFDSALFGGTSPVLGTRSRVEVAPLAGDIRFTETLLDYRRYLSPVRPLTIAVRAMHVGRYGPDADASSIAPLFIGHPNLVRGYDVGSFAAVECRPDGSSECPQFDRLVGSRVFVGNLELRAPIPGLFKGRFEYWPLPIEAFAFADTGVAWTSDVAPVFLDGSRDFVSSVGFGARVNVLGYLITEFNAVRAVDRPDNGWRFVFNLRPGF
jgi:Tol biopolymer transport system component